MKRLAAARKKLDRSDVQADLDQALAKLKLISPAKVFLVGSVARNQITDQSDIDFLLVFKTKEELRQGQKKLGPHYPLCQVPTELIWMTEEEFDSRKSKGGIALEAESEGELLFVLAGKGDAST